MQGNTAAKDTPKACLSFLMKPPAQPEALASNQLHLPAIRRNPQNAAYLTFFKDHIKGNPPFASETKSRPQKTHRSCRKTIDRYSPAVPFLRRGSLLFFAAASALRHIYHQGPAFAAHLIFAASGGEEQAVALFNAQLLTSAGQHPLPFHNEQRMEGRLIAAG